LKIGVDARLLSRPLTGIGRYTLEMCRALSKVENISLCLYSPAPFRPDAILDLDKVNVRTGSWDSGVLRQLWSETYLPKWAANDAVDVFWGPAHRLPLRLPKSMARVVTIHDLVWKYAGDTMRPLSRLLERYQVPLAVRAADAVIVDSGSTAKAVREEFGIDYDKLNVVHLGVNLVAIEPPFSSLQQFGIDRPYFLFVGTIEPRKNLIRLLTAYANLAQSVKEQAVLVIAGGEGWGSINIHDAVDSLGLKDKVHLLGYVDEPSLAGLYANAQFLAMPSLYEGFGLPLVEAMANGVPVLTSDNSSMPEVAGNAGLLVDAKDVDSISDGLNQLITNKELRSRLAANAKINAERFSWDESAERVLAVFENAIAVRRSHLS
jgi:glycosyltransferase involved in cell wall biosynthesis